jgi:Secretory lipase
MRIRFLVAFLGFSLAGPAALFACGSSATPAAASHLDASMPHADAAPTSTATTGPDAAPTTDAGPPLGDAGPDDAAADAPTALASVPAIACSDTLANVYVTPSNLPPMTMAERGDIVRCAPDVELTVYDENTDFASKSVTGVTPTTGVNLYRIAYRTYRDDGVPGVSTARVYLPQTPRSLPLPVVAVAHPTEGLAPSCTPSMDPTSLYDEALPWAASGFAVIASDYAGLGNAGVQGYFDNHDEAHSMLDSARALRALLPPSVLGDDVLLVGYSQGGGAVLASQGLASSYGAGGTIDAIVVFAAEYFERLNSVQFVTALESPTELTIQSGVTVPDVIAMRDYAFGYNVLGPDASTETFPASSGPGIANAAMTLCEVPLGGYIQGVAPHLGDLFDPTFQTSLTACVGQEAGCTGLGSQFYAWMENDLVAPDPHGAPILYVQGLSDTIMPPAQEAACNIGKLEDAGVSVQVCTDPAATHTDVVARNVAFAMSWSMAVLDKTAVPACSGAGLPACMP